MNSLKVKRVIAALSITAALGLSVTAQSRGGYMGAANRTDSAIMADDGGGGLGSGNAVCNGQLGSGNAVCGRQLGSGGITADGGGTLGNGNFWTWIVSFI